MNIPAIKTILRERGINQVVLAKRLGVTKSTVSRLLADGNNPHAESVARIAKALGISVARLLRRR